jgi:hypothetical protein
MIQTDPAPIRVLADLGDEQIYHSFLAIERTYVPSEPAG